MPVALKQPGTPDGWAGISSPGCPAVTKTLDLNKLLIRSASRTIRTEEDWRRLFDRAGLRLQRVIQTETEYKIVEGVSKEA